ncbi:MAG: class I SAM-dependent methyltransferase [Woeseiaceae bacterium]
MTIFSIFLPGLRARLFIAPALLLTAMAGLTACTQAAAPAAEAGTAQRYQQKTPSRDGIGKVYMGREISHVMGHLGAGWLERPGRQAEEATDKLISALPLKSDSVVADIGAGTGYFSLPIARRVPDGKVIAVDIQQEMIDLIDARVEADDIGNIESRLSTIEDPALDDATVDLALIVDAYHEFSHPFEMGVGIKQGLKPGGLLVLVEYREEDRSVPIKPLHKMSQAQVKLEMAAIGLEWVETLDVLPQQHILIFRRPLTAPPAL